MIGTHKLKYSHHPPRLLKYSKAHSSPNCLQIYIRDIESKIIATVPFKGKQFIN